MRYYIKLDGDMYYDGDFAGSLFTKRLDMAVFFGTKDSADQALDELRSDWPEATLERVTPTKVEPVTIIDELISTKKELSHIMTLYNSVWKIMLNHFKAWSDNFVDAIKNMDKEIVKDSKITTDYKQTVSHAVVTDKDRPIDVYDRYLRAIPAEFFADRLETSIINLVKAHAAEREDRDGWYEEASELATKVRDLQTENERLKAQLTSLHTAGIVNAI